ncbi:hypothetical protein [Roseococcus pinisoli]|uniref:Uncharacterized protein n=1 Tax=Roseococcus pinisoli TaxID=2835040 RepID=A0ABS5QGC3_9PROT|nr:hypothetical protein [Roseococcus pinisoli]MBS7812634.1 hypothetical protein [Roseococcus pinisoli]
MSDVANPPLPARSFDVLAIMTAIESLLGILVMARALVMAGRAIDLAGLDREAARLAAAIACLPPGVGHPLKPSLEALMREADLLAEHLPRP